MVFPPCKFAFQTKAYDVTRNERNTKPKVRHYGRRFIDLDEYLDFFPGATLSDKIYVIELNGIILNIITNSFSKQAYVRGFGCESISFKGMLICLSIWK